MKTPSAVGESAAIVTVLSFIYWGASNSPAWAFGMWVFFGLLFVFDWMLGGITDQGLCKKCL